jgi:hypothetical protein
VTPAGHRFVWDLDKTYLQTEFETVRGLLRAAFESPEDKVAYPGAAVVLRALKRRPEHRLHILSGSPRQMRRKLERKLSLDGVTWDRFTLKPNLENVLRGRLSEVRGQVGYKLEALLSARARYGDPPETMMGDDAEADAFVYSLYADLTAGRVPRRTLDTILDDAGCGDHLQAAIAAALDGIVLADRVRRILIHLDRRTPPGLLAQIHGPRLVPVFNYFQAAIVLWADGHLDARAVAEVAGELATSAGYGASALVNSLEDLVRRAALSPEQAVEAGTHPRLSAVLGPSQMRALSDRLRGAAPAGLDAHNAGQRTPDYADLFARTRGRARRPH